MVLPSSTHRKPPYLRAPRSSDARAAPVHLVAEIGRDPVAAAYIVLGFGVVLAGDRAINRASAAGLIADGLAHTRDQRHEAAIRSTPGLETVPL
jgi:hypothetical protein